MLKNLSPFRTPAPLAIDADQSQGSADFQASQRIQDEIILRRGGVFVVNQGFDETDSATVIAGATVTLLSVTVPDGTDQSLLITHYANILSDMAALGFFTWNMYIDSVPVKAYFGVVDQLGTTNQMRKVGVDILVNSGQTLRVDAVSTAALPYGAGISLMGVYGTYDYLKG